MKKFISVALCLATVFCSLIVANAENVFLWSENVEAKNNRLFEVDIYVDSSFNLTAATFELSYDSTIMEYRDVSTDIVDGQIKATDTDGKVKAIFLNSEGVSGNGGVKLFSAIFKAVGEGSCNVGISMYDCVDNDAVTTNDKASTQLAVTISGSRSSDNSSADAKSKTDNVGAPEEETESQSIKYLSVATQKDNTKEYLIIIIVLILVISALMFYCGKLRDAKEKVQKQFESDAKDTEESKDGFIDNEPIENECDEKRLVEDEFSEN